MRKIDKVITRRDVTFDESKFLLSSDANRPDENPELLFIPTESAETVEIETGPHDDTMVRRSERVSRPPDRYGFEQYADTAITEHFFCTMCVRYLNQKP